ncbi:MAG: hypothetical protein WAL52_12890 [Candidatus Sulfotelmatobacter sp.]
MRIIGFVSTAVLSLILAAPVYAQEQHDQAEEKAKPEQNEKKAQPEKSSKSEERGAQPEKSAKPEERNARQENNAKPEQKVAPRENNSKPEERNAQQQHAQPAQHASNHAGRIPADRYKANFGREHSFRVSEGDYRNHRFQYGGYWFGFAAPWPSNWLYTQDVYVVEIGGVYYLCNPAYPGVNVELNVTL